MAGYSVITSDHICVKHLQRHEVEVPEERYVAWKAGLGHIQNMLPMLSASDREILMTGTCQEAWDEMFPEDDLTYEDSLGQAD